MDKRARQILFDTYWSSAGWVSGERKAAPEDFEYAKAHGVMFDPVVMTHDETIARLQAVVARLNVTEVVSAFLASLSTRRLDWRSALGSFFLAHRMPLHPETLRDRGCAVCGFYTGAREEDLNVLNFERLKWGGVRHLNPVYALFDLELFLAAPRPAPTPEDSRIFRDLVSAIESAPASVTSAALHKHLAGALKSNKAERDQLIAILGIAGVLDTPEHPGFADEFVPNSARVLPDRHFVDMPYPACWWDGSVGLNRERLQALFGTALDG